MILVLDLIIGSRQPETDLTLKDFRALGVRNLKVCFHSRVCRSNIQDQGKLVEAESQSLNSVTLWISYQNDAMIFHEGTLTFKTPLIWGLDQLLFIKQNPIKSSDIHVWFNSTFHSNYYWSGKLVKNKVSELIQQGKFIDRVHFWKYNQATHTRGYIDTYIHACLTKSMNLSSEIFN